MEEEEERDQLAAKRNRADIITFTEEQAAELAKTSPGEEASVSEKVSPLVLLPPLTSPPPHRHRGHARGGESCHVQYQSKVD